MLPICYRLNRKLAAFLLAAALAVSFPSFETLSSDSSNLITVWQGAASVYLLTPSLADSLGLKDLAPQFQVIDGRLPVILTTKGKLYDLAARKFFPANSPLNIESFTISDGLLVALRNGRLGWYEKGEIKERLALPSKKMQVAAGTGQRLYLYGPLGKGSVVYLLEDKKALRLVDIPHGRIVAFTAIGERIFFAVNNAIYTVAKGEPPGLVFIAAGKEPIRSLAADPIGGVLYFSAGEAVYVMRAGVALSVLKGLKGELCYSKNALFILDPGQRCLLKITGLQKLIIGGGGATSRAIKPDAFKE